MPKQDKRAYNLVLTPERREIVETLWDALLASENEIIQVLIIQEKFEFRKLIKYLYEKNM